MVAGLHDAQHSQAVSTLRLLIGGRMDGSLLRRLAGMDGPSPGPTIARTVRAQQRVS
jgi:hypothetical protein